ncbi:MAG: ankyrin repeat domain-containing protein [Rickettsiales bacterium]
MSESERPARRPRAASAGRGIVAKEERDSSGSGSLEELKRKLTEYARAKDVVGVELICEELHRDYSDMMSGPYSGVSEAEEVINGLYRDLLREVWNTDNKEFDLVINALSENGADLEVARQVMREKEGSSLYGDLKDGVAWISRPVLGHNIKATEELVRLALVRQRHNVRPEKLHLLIKDGADINAVDGRGFIPLHLAVEKGRTETVRMLIEAGADINAVDGWGFIPLHLAVKKWYTETVRMLIEAGADVNMRTGDGSTALHLAAQEDHTEAVRMLIEAGADVNMRNGAGNIALHLAVEKGHTEAVRMLIEAGADVNALGRLSKPLHNAARSGHAETARMLIEAGADMNAVDRDDKTVLAIAIEGGNIEVAKLLIETGAELDFSKVNVSLFNFNVFDNPVSYAVFTDGGFPFTDKQREKLDFWFNRNVHARNIYENHQHISEARTPVERASRVLRLGDSEYAADYLSYQMLRYRDSVNIEDALQFRDSVLNGIKGWDNEERIKAAVEKSARAVNTLMSLKGIKPSKEIGLDTDLLYREGGIEALEKIDHPDAVSLRKAISDLGSYAFFSVAVNLSKSLLDLSPKEVQLEISKAINSSMEERESLMEKHESGEELSEEEEDRILKIDQEILFLDRMRGEGSALPSVIKSAISGALSSIDEESLQQFRGHDEELEVEASKSEERSRSLEELGPMARRLHEDALARASRGRSDTPKRSTTPVVERSSGGGRASTPARKRASSPDRGRG